MKFSAIITLAFSAVALSQEVVSKPFKLVIKSSDKSINGKKLVACHTGAAIESLCIYGNSGSNFNLNTTKGSQSSLAGYSPEGTLTWLLPTEPAVSEPMNFYVDPATNVALPLFEPGYDTTLVSVNKKDSTLAVISYFDDTKENEGEQKPVALKNWYVCHTNYLGYSYQTLNWVLGNAKAKPQNPTCIKVDVVRKFT